MNITFVDLKAQYNSIKKEIDTAIQSVIDDTAFIKGKYALTDVDLFTVINDTKGTKVDIGYSSTNTNRVNIPVDVTKQNLTDSVTFNANLFKEVLVANKECTSAVLEVSNDGLARVNFKIDEYDSTYYIVAMTDVD